MGNRSKVIQIETNSETAKRVQFVLRLIHIADQSALRDFKIQVRSDAPSILQYLPNVLKKSSILELPDRKINRG